MVPPDAVTETATPPQTELPDFETLTVGVLDTIIVPVAVGLPHVPPNGVSTYV